ncbi:MAG: hypothetical protein DWQ37_04225 [Planctomycetota bacterium]|nr:MAG: hypothetical protein DWQ37_04225 [Planctomycetota bacterium]
MSNTVSNVALILRSLVSLVILGLLGTGGFVAYRAFDERSALERELSEKSAELAKLAADNAELTKENARLDLALRLLKVDHRVAQVEVLDQQDGERPTTRFRFVEMTEDGTPIGEEKVFTIEGDRLYVDALVIKYDDKLIESNDPLRSTSVCLFERVFGEFQEPSKGFPLDAQDSRPAVYSQGKEMTPEEREIWDNFWEYANSPAKAQAAGVRAAHGEAPSIRLQPGKRYRVELRASGGLSIVPEDVPPKDAA